MVKKILAYMGTVIHRNVINLLVRCSRLPPLIFVARSHAPAWECRPAAPAARVQTRRWSVDTLPAPERKKGLDV